VAVVLVRVWCFGSTFELGPVPCRLAWVRSI